VKEIKRKKEMQMGEVYGIKAYEIMLHSNVYIIVLIVIIVEKDKPVRL
jgi:hypothetical protein